MKGMRQFWNEQADWSERTFGIERGPVGPMKHLRKEVDEVLERLEAQTPSLDCFYSREELLEEFADCLFLLFDATRRAKFGFKDLVRAAFKKLAKNKTRIWPTPTKGDEPIEHERGIND
jgi:NTP pyrophosphatase (non-canonical NTP hydrolase)